MTCKKVICGVIYCLEKTIGLMAVASSLWNIFRPQGQGISLFPLLAWKLLGIYFLKRCIKLQFYL